MGLVLERPEVQSASSITASGSFHRTDYEVGDLTPIELRLMGGSGVGISSTDELGSAEIAVLADRAIAGDEAAYKRVMTPVNALQSRRLNEDIQTGRDTIGESRRLKSIFLGAFRFEGASLVRLVKAGVQPYIEPAKMNPGGSTVDQWRVFLLTKDNQIHPDNEQLLEEVGVKKEWRDWLHLEKPAPLLPEELSFYQDPEPLAYNPDGSPNYLILKLGPKVDTTTVPPAFEQFAHFW